MPIRNSLTYCSFLRKSPQTELLAYLNRWTNQILSPRIGEDKHLTGIKSQYFTQTSQNLVGRMAYAGFKMADVCGRDFNSPTDLLLSQIQLAAALANQLPKVRLARTPRHGGGVSFRTCGPF